MRATVSRPGNGVNKDTVNCAIANARYSAIIALQVRVSIELTKRCKASAVRFTLVIAQLVAGSTISKVDPTPTSLSKRMLPL